MAELLIEIFSEEMPAKIQKPSAEYLSNSLTEAFEKNGIICANSKIFYSPRRLTFVCDVPLSSHDVLDERKGPRIDAPSAAIDGFLKSTGLNLEQLEQRDTGKGLFYFANILKKGQKTTDICEQVIPDILHKFPFAKSMRWGSGDFKWVRPVQKILAILSENNTVYPIHFQVGHLHSGNITGGHHFMSPDLFKVENFADYTQKMQDNFVIFDQNIRKEKMQNDLIQTAEKLGLVYLSDDDLLQEVMGLCEYPVILVGDIADKFQNLPPEVLKTSMRSHQKFFSFYDKKSDKITKFATFCNIIPDDEGDLIIQGNQRVLAARLSDGQYFYELDLKKPLETHAEKLKDVTYHAQLGTQSQRILRIESVASYIAKTINIDCDTVSQIARLAKADLSTAMVGEFPELQGIMGAYYAKHYGHDDTVCDGIKNHYKPVGAGDDTVISLFAACVAIADKIDSLAGFWAMGEKPTGSKDPYALRRAALGVIRIILDNNISLNITDILKQAFDVLSKQFDKTESFAVPNMQISNYNRFISELPDLQNFILERLKIYMRDKNISHDVISAVIPVTNPHINIIHIYNNGFILQDFIKTPQGQSLMQSYRRGINILSAEEKKNNTTYDPVAQQTRFDTDYEQNLFKIIANIENDIKDDLLKNNFDSALLKLLGLQNPLSDFFEHLMVNDSNTQIRQNRLGLLSYLRQVIHYVADFSKIECKNQ